MEAKFQRRIQRYGWDAAAPIYEDSWRSNLKRPQDVLLQMADLVPGQRVLETAAGSGLVTRRLAEAVGPEGQVVATDIAGEMVSVCADSLGRAGLSNTVCERMDSENLGFDAASFDRTICALGLMLMPEPVQALREMKRVLKPGGKAAVLVWGQRKHCGWAEIFPIIDAQVESEVCPLFFSLGAPDALQAAMTEAGFGDVVEERLPMTLAFPDGQSLLRAQIDGGAVALAAKRFSPVTRRKVEEAFLASVAQYRVGTQYEIPSEFVAAVGSA